MMELISSDGKVKAAIIKKEHGGYVFEEIEEIICLNHNLEFVRKITSNGVKVLRQQCNNCGLEVSNGLKNNMVENIDLLKSYNPDLNYMNFTYRKEFSHQLKVEKNNDAFQKYNFYLQSDQWKLKRKKVLERDKNVCQACLTNKAEEVHHLTYDNIFDEFLFELVSVCKNCHNEIENNKRIKRGY